jgi:aspartate kinase
LDSVRVFKFGGASVQDAQGIARVHRLVCTYGEGPLWVVISAMGKTTNQLEWLVRAVDQQQWPLAMEILGQLKEAHQERIGPLSSVESEQRRLNDVLEHWMGRLKTDLDRLRVAHLSYNCLYDQIVVYGELISTALVSAYFEIQGFAHGWVDAGDLLVTDSTWRDARIHWEETVSKVKACHRLHCGNSPGSSGAFVLTQGFMGQDAGSGLRTTLGREGSDFTASVLAYALDAREVCVWKDVAGVMDADPRLFPMARILPSLSYREAVEMTYYGASVIHPRTIQPLQNKGISLRVRSFLNPEQGGTVIGEMKDGGNFSPCVIVKKNQCLLELVSRDFSFVGEEGLALIYKALYDQGLKANLARQTAVSFSLCVDNDPYKRQPVQQTLESDFAVQITEGLSLWTLMHQSEKMRSGLLSGKQILFEQHLGNVCQYVVVD